MKRVDGNRVMGAVATVAAVFWMFSTASGGHPDGALLGFSSTLFAVAATNERRSYHARERARRGSVTWEPDSDGDSTGEDYHDDDRR